MPQIGFPQKNILEPLASDYPATTPAGAGRSSFILGQRLIEDQAQRDLSRPFSDLAPLANPYRVDIVQPDNPKANSPITGGPFDIGETVQARAVSNTRVVNSIVLSQPKTTGFGSGYGAMSGGTPKGEESDGYGTSANTQASFPAIDRVGSRNNANMHVIARPGAALPFLA